jgi:hypothetical protein
VVADTDQKKAAHHMHGSRLVAGYKVAGLDLASERARWVATRAARGKAATA